MSPTDTLARMIAERERDIAELQAEIDVLRGANSAAKHAFAVAGDGAEAVTLPYRPMR